MRIIEVNEVADRLRDCIQKAQFTLGQAECAALHRSLEHEYTPNAKAILCDLKKNHSIALTENRPLCQDTGVAVIFLELGQEVQLVGGILDDVLREAVATAYRENYLRASMVRHPLQRRNTGDNTPPIIHLKIVPGNRVRLRFAAKGGGCENMSRLKMLPPAAGRTGVLNFVVETVQRAGGNACPPLVVGVGLGGNFEKAALLAKEALLRPLGIRSDYPQDAELEQVLLQRLNDTGIGPMGLGGNSTALAVHVNSHACHIASLPVAVNLDCHSHRHAECII